MTRLRWAVAGLCLLGVATVSVVIVRSLRRPEIYLANGGDDYVVIVRGLTGFRIQGHSFVGADTDSSFTVRRAGNTMLLAFDSPYFQSESTFTSHPVKKHDWILTASNTSSDGISGNSDETRFSETDPYLQRLDDELIPKYFQELRPIEEGFEADTRKAVETAKSLLKKYPGNEFVIGLNLRCMLYAGDDDGLAGMLRENSAATISNIYARSIARTAEYHLAARQLSKSGMNAADIIPNILDPKADLSKRLLLIRSLVQFDKSRFAWPRPDQSPNFLEAQTLIKITRIHTIFLLLQAQWRDAFELSVGAYRMGQIYETYFTYIGQVIGTALRAIACGGLEIIVLNAPVSSEEFGWMAGQLDWLYNIDIDRPYIEESPSLFGTFYKEYMSRADVTDARFSNVRSALAVRRALLDQNSSHSQENLITDKELAIDPFTSRSTSMRIGQEEVVCYSFGPDTIDNLAEVTYDPTNGAISTGDIITTVARQPRYPFTRRPFFAASVEDLRSRFPNGLPVDPFADTKGKGLSWNTTVPLHIYSYGPDTDEGNIAPLEPFYVPSVQYDPTNGTINQGDIYMVLPKTPLAGVREE
jgi:hypothetical protein